MKRPYVICHMGSTVDGRIIGEHWGENHETFGALYEQCHNSFDSQAWMVGRVTMEKDFTEGKQPEPRTPDKPIAREPFIGDKEATSFAIAVDPGGKLGWESNEIDGDHVIEILTEGVSDNYLFYLQQQGVSYIFAGEKRIDFELAISQLGNIFPIKTIMLEGGGHINGSLLNAGLIDELSLLILPIADGAPKTPTTFEVGKYLQKKPAAQLHLTGVERLESDVVWLKYRF
ncbi:MAG TPA: RibD family protein [Chitinophagaceae bacterium]|nr:RibD family protein [Chitinophagaceae bacterium]